MLILSVFMGVLTNLGWFTLYSAELLGPISSMRRLNSIWHYNSLIHWCVLLLSHIMVASLIFLTKKENFNLLLIWFPLQFILMFASFDFISSFFLIPFIIVWIITIRKSIKLKKNQGTP